MAESRDSAVVFFGLLIEFCGKPTLSGEIFYLKKATNGIKKHTVLH